MAYLEKYTRKLSGPAVACLRNEETRETYVEELYFRQNGYSFPGTEHRYCAVTEI